MTLDVYAPAHTRAGGYPGMIFVHGGRFITGGCFMYDGRGPFTLASPPAAADCATWDPIFDREEAAY